MSKLKASWGERTYAIYKIVTNNKEEKRNFTEEAWTEVKVNVTSGVPCCQVDWTRKVDDIDPATKDASLESKSGGGSGTHHEGT